VNHERTELCINEVYHTYKIELTNDNLLIEKYGGQGFSVKSPKENKMHYWNVRQFTSYISHTYTNGHNVFGNDRIDYKKVRTDQKSMMKAMSTPITLCATNLLLTSWHKLTCTRLYIVTMMVAVSRRYFISFQHILNHYNYNKYIFRFNFRTSNTHGHVKALNERSQLFVLACVIFT
jgi:hypothetical protein